MNRLKKLILILTLTLFYLAGCKNNNNTVSSINISESKSSNLSTYLNSELIADNERYMPEHWENTESNPPVSFDSIMSFAEKREISSVVDKIEVSGNYEMPLITNKTPLIQIMSEVDIAVVMSHIWGGYIHTIMNYDLYPQSYMEDPNYYVPVTFLRQTKEGCYYTVCKVKEGGYAYFFFERPYNIMQKKYDTDDLTYALLTGCVYSENALQKSDFDSLQIGDSIDRVIEIDSAAKITKQWSDWNKDITGVPIDINVSIHLLKDGLLSIEYDESFAIKNITFSEDFIFYPVLNPDYPKYFGTLPQDYPPET